MLTQFLWFVAILATLFLGGFGIGLYNRQGTLPSYAIFLAASLTAVLVQLNSPLPRPGLLVEGVALLMSVAFMMIPGITLGEKSRNHLRQAYRKNQAC